MHSKDNFPYLNAFTLPLLVFGHCLKHKKLRARLDRFVHYSATTSKLSFSNLSCLTLFCKLVITCKLVCA